MSNVRSWPKTEASAWIRERVGKSFIVNLVLFWAREQDSFSTHLFTTDLSMCGNYMAAPCFSPSPLYFSL